MAIKIWVAVAIAATAMPAFGAVTVIANRSPARICYEAADSPLMPSAAAVRVCDTAFAEPLSWRDTLATHVNRGILRLRRGQIDDAIADFDRAISMDPGQPEAYLNKGAALIRMNNAAQLPEALRLFTVALEQNTQRPAIAHFGRAIVNEELGNVRAAYMDYRRASELDPDWEDPRLELTRFRIVNQ